MCTSVEYKTPTLHDVYKYVVPKHAHMWEHLGALLHFSQAELDIILANYFYDNKKCCGKLLSMWLQKNCDASWDQLLTAIDDLGMKL